MGLARLVSNNSWWISWTIIIDINYIMDNISKGQFGWISRLKDSIKHTFSTPSVKATNSRVNLSLDANGRLKVGNKYPVKGYTFIDLNGNTFRVDFDGKPKLIKTKGGNQFPKAKQPKGNGWNDNNYFSRNTRIAASGAVNPSWRMSNPLNHLKGAASMGINSILTLATPLNMPVIQNKGGSTQDDLNMWGTYLGYDMGVPKNNIRFTGDKNKDNKTYVGVSKETKDFIRSAIESGDLKVNPDGSWTSVSEVGADYPNSKPYHASHLGNYAIRQNNGSGIYDIFDSYDFPWYVAIPSRNKGQELEIRDTIWSNKANPDAYRVNYSVTPKLR